MVLYCRFQGSRPWVSPFTRLWTAPTTSCIVCRPPRALWSGPTCTTTTAWTTTPAAPTPSWPSSPTPATTWKTPWWGKQTSDSSSLPQEQRILSARSLLKGVLHNCHFQVSQWAVNVFFVSARFNEWSVSQSGWRKVMLRAEGRPGDLIYARTYMLAQVNGSG